MKRLLFAAFLIISACNDDDGPSTIIIDTDPGTMKMEIDGTATISSPKMPPHASVLTQSTGTIIAYFEKEPNEFVGITISINKIKKGTFPLGGQGSVVVMPDVYVYVTPIDNQGVYASYSYSESVSGTITITELDLTAKVISGTFQVKLQRSAEPKVLTLTRGQFNKILID